MQPTQTHLVSDPAHLEAAVETLAAGPAIGLDTEFVRERTYFPKPGLIQFSDGREAWLVDPVALADEPALEQRLGALLRDRTATKILHSTGEDLEVLRLVGDEAPEPLFDTQRAAALLGWPLQVRYENLAEDLLGVEFPGGLGRNDWLRRPLPSAWIEYAAADVIALPRMQDELSERLERAGRLAWLEEDCRRIVERAAVDAHPVVRIKGAAGLDDAALSRLAMLAEWREQAARERDLPRGFVARDPLLLDLARAEPGDMDALLRSGEHGRPPRRADREAMRRAVEQAPSDWQRPPELTQLSGGQRSRIKELQAHVRAIADELGVDPALLASRRDLTRRVQGAPCDWLDGWRGELLGEL